MSRLLVLLALACSAPASLACSYSVDPFVSRLDEPDLVAVGTVESVDSTRAAFRIERIVQGSAWPTMSIPSFWVSPCDDVWRLTPGEKWLVALDTEGQREPSFSRAPIHPHQRVRTTHDAVVEAAAFLVDTRYIQDPKLLHRAWRALPDSVRSEAIHGFDHRPDSRFVYTLRQTLKLPRHIRNRRDSVRLEIAERALHPIRQHEHREAFPELRALSEREGGPLWRGALHTLAELRDPTRFDLWTDRVRSAEPHIAEEYAHALATLGDLRAAPVLLEVLRRETDRIAQDRSHPQRLSLVVGYALAALDPEAAADDVIAWFRATRHAVPLNKAVLLLHRYDALIATLLSDLEEELARAKANDWYRSESEIEGLIRGIREQMREAERPPCECPEGFQPPRTFGLAEPSPRDPVARRSGPLRLGEITEIVAPAEVLAPSGAGLADVDGDGDLDPIVVSRDGGFLGWYPNEGGGAFGTLTVIASGLEGATGLDIGDVDGDGDEDLVMALGTDDRIAWWRNVGGHFASAGTVASGLWKLERAHVGDVDGDGDLDVLVSTLQSTHVVLNTDGKGSFGEPTELPINYGRPPYERLVDADGDGDLDLVLPTTVEDDEVGFREQWRVLLNDGGTFTPLPVSDEWTGDGVAVVAEGLTGNGTLGAVTRYSNGITRIREVSPAEVSRFPLQRRDPGWARSVATGDVTGDGIPDVVMGGASRIDLATVDPEVVSRGLAESPTVERWESLALGDLDGDGDLDVLAAALETDRVVWFENRGRADFGEARPISRPSALLKPSSPVRLDLDGDGDLDIAFKTIDPERLLALENRGGGRFALRPDTLSTESVHLVSVTDLDGDGTQDVVARGPGGFDQPIVAAHPTSAWTLSAFESASDPLDRATSVYDGAAARGRVIEEWRGDLLWTRDGGETLCSLENRRRWLDGNLLIVSARGERREDLLVGERDGPLEWFVASGRSRELCLVRQISQRGEPLAARDLDGDGDLDVLARERQVSADSTQSGNGLVWHEQTGAGFTRHALPRTFLEHGYAEPVVEDLDGDGRPDVLFARRITPPFVQPEYELAVVRGIEGGLGEAEPLGGRTVTLNGRFFVDVGKDGAVHLVVFSMERGESWSAPLVSAPPE